MTLSELLDFAGVNPCDCYGSLSFGRIKRGRGANAGQELNNQAIYWEGRPIGEFLANGHGRCTPVTPGRKPRTASGERQKAPSKVLKALKSRTSKQKLKRKRAR